MSNHKELTFGAMRRRGWTTALTKQLLPKPTVHRFGSRTVRCWDKKTVLAAEQTPQFQEQRQQPQEAAPAPAPSAEPLPMPSADTPLGRAKELLDSAWAKGEAGDDPVSRLAGLYHQAIVGRLPAASWAVSLKPAQAAGRIENFLHLQHYKSSDAFVSLMKNFVTAAPWLGDNLDSLQAKRIYDGYAQQLRAAAEMALEEFHADHPEVNVEPLLALDSFPTGELMAHSLGYIYSVYYVPLAIQKSLAFLTELQPPDEYPAARAMKRHFIVHVGGTNTGKTYAGFQRLQKAETGVYLAPLRLLALEAQELLLNQGVACSLTTGEEEDCRPDDTHVAATAEKLNLGQQYEVAVIDECQMIADRERGYAWTRAILGVQAPEVHLCAAPEAKNLLLRIIQSCGDTYEVVEHERKTPLVCMNRTVDYSSVQPGDALITFSKVGVLSVAEDLRARGKEPAIIYGALPYSTRRKQVEGFLAGDMEYVVSTDAIGMGLNLPIRRIIFMETEKFDGHERRELKPEEIKQIAGRAGRYGMYDKGYVGAMDNLSLIRAGLETVVPPLQSAVVGFSDLMMGVDFDILEVLEVWNKMPTPEPYIKLDISRYIALITRIRQAGFTLTKAQELRAANIPFDETDRDLSDLFFALLRQWVNQGEVSSAALEQALEKRSEDESSEHEAPAPEVVEDETQAEDEQTDQLTRPTLPEKKRAYTLPELELYCRKLDLYFCFAKAFHCTVDKQGLYEERERVADEINQILLHNLKNNIRFCVRCNAALPLHHNSRICNDCYNKMYRQSRPHRRH
jgi:ATP-dependent RNA helicase SUPV3L1/SUV3